MSIGRGGGGVNARPDGRAAAGRGRPPRRGQRGPAAPRAHEARRCGIKRRIGDRRVHAIHASSRRGPTLARDAALDDATPTDGPPECRRPGAAGRKRSIGRRVSRITAAGWPRSGIDAYVRCTRSRPPSLRSGYATVSGSPVSSIVLSPDTMSTTRPLNPDSIREPGTSADVTVSLVGPPSSPASIAHVSRPGEREARLVHRTARSLRGSAVGVGSTTGPSCADRTVLVRGNARGAAAPARRAPLEST